MRLGASVAFAFNSLAQGPVTRKSCRRRESNPGPRDSRPDTLATLPPRFATMYNRTLQKCTYKNVHSKMYIQKCALHTCDITALVTLWQCGIG